MASNLPRPASPEATRLQRRRRRRIAATGVLLVVLLVLLFLPQAVSLRLAHPDLGWLLFLISALSFVGVVILTIVLVRLITRLYADRRANILGAKFKTRLVIGALGLSLVPVLCMFGFTYGLINRTLEKWFSRPVETVRDDTRVIGDTLTAYIQSNAMQEAAALAADPTIVDGIRAHDWARVRSAVGWHQAVRPGSFVRVLNADGQGEFAWSAPEPGAPAPGAGGGGGPPLRAPAGTQPYVFGNAPVPGVRPQHTIEVGLPRPPAFTAQMTELAQDYANYNHLAQERRSLRLIYTGLLLLLTLAVLFGSTWMALYLSRTVTEPIAALAAATQEISRGNLAYRVAPSGHDEVGELVTSFNRMAGQLEANRSQIEAGRQQLERANRELDERRRYTEALLENTPTAVISLQRDFSIARINPAVSRMLGGPPAPRSLDQLFDGASRQKLQRLLRKSERWPAATAQLEVNAGGRLLTLAVTAAAIRQRGAHPFSGYVLVAEDLTDLLRVQKMAAWREVAQRIAHEIRNPLTPIALSAERLRRRVTADASVSASPSAAIVLECAATIDAEVASLQRLVAEFSSFARFPSAQPVACDLNDVLERALRSFDGRLEGIQVRTEFSTLPPLQLDPEEMRRVFVNLIDNAAEAMQASPYRQITLATRFEQGVVEAAVADTGPGLPAGDRHRMFLPYISTKERGTGLGLAIVARIVEENGGAIRVEDNTPVGARFIVEFPLIEPAEAVAAADVTTG